MKASVRLALAILLFGSWISWLAYLAATTTRPIVLSRPQFLVSTLDVIARVEADGPRPHPLVHVTDVHWPTDQADLKLKSISVRNLPQCAGWQSPGEYILPLVKSGDAFEVARVPPSPGYVPSGNSPALRIYPRTAETVRQLEGIGKPK